MDTKLEEYVESFAIEKRYRALSNDAFDDLREDLITQAMCWLEKLIGGGFIKDAISNELSRYSGPYAVWQRSFDGQRRYDEFTVNLLNQAILHSSVSMPEELTRYGDEGISIAKDEQSEKIKNSESFIMMTPGSWFVTEDMRETFQAYTQITAKAKARMRLDDGEDLHFVDVYLLSGMNYKSVRNATQARHGAGRLKVGNGDMVDNENAIQWLLNRKGFRPTPGSQYCYEQKPSQSEDYYVFIPVDEDGTALRPSEMEYLPLVDHNVYRLYIDGIEHYEMKIEDVLDLIKNSDEIKWFPGPDKGKKEASYWQRVRRADLIKEDEETVRHKKEVWEEENKDLLDELEQWPDLPDGDPASTK